MANIISTNEMKWGSWLEMIGRFPVDISYRGKVVARAVPVDDAGKEAGTVN
ncbi:MAG: hypothetical protein U1D67_03175 [Dehalococcoidia bacterium]|nr:hypothetical protein [Dehalococcoidia bacterium]MDZ4246102.1 hypothetical protein [Dehalococcoidia bacterium]